MNWFKKIITAHTFPLKNYRGEEYYLVPDSKLNDELRSMVKRITGRSFPWKTGVWPIHESISNRVEVMDFLDFASGSRPYTPSSPESSQPEPLQPLRPEPSQSDNNGGEPYISDPAFNPPWFGAKFKATGVFVVMKALDKKGSSFYWKNEAGRSGTVQRSNSQILFESILDENGNKLLSSDPNFLFQRMKEITSSQLSEEDKDEAVQPDEEAVQHEDEKPEDEKPEDEKLEDEKPEDEENKNEEKKDDQPVKGRIPDHQISEYQKEIENTFKETDKPIVMNALAGSGKTTMLRHLASMKDPSEKWLYLVFNKRNQIEASSKFPQGVEVATSHSFLGNRVLQPASEDGVIRNTQIWKSEAMGGKYNKLSSTVDQLVNDISVFRKNGKTKKAKFFINNLTSLAKNFSLDPRKPSIADDLERIMKMYGDMLDPYLSTEREKEEGSETDFTPFLIDASIKALMSSLPGNSVDNSYEQFRDHDDTLWLSSIIEGISFPRYDVVLADEVQDFNKCQMIMLQKLKEQGARIVAVGDPNQAIYRFRGADSNAFDNIQKMMSESGSDIADHSLPVNYRSGKNIIEFVNNNSIVNNLQAGADFDGSVNLGQTCEGGIDSICDEWSKNGGKLKQQTAMICRTNKPLVDAAVRFMKEDVDFEILGKDMSKDIIQFVGKAIGFGRYAKHVSAESMNTTFSNYMMQCEDAWHNKMSKQNELKEVLDIGEAILSVLGFLSSNDWHDKKTNMKIRDSKDFLEYVRRRFKGIDETSHNDVKRLENKDQNSFVTLTTAHKSKGFEYSKVCLMGERKDFAEKDPQGENVWYVAATRAEHELHVLKI